MALDLQGRQSLDVQFDGQSFPFGEMQELKYLHMVESVYQTIPTLSICVKDNSRWLARNKFLSDATVITITVSSGSGDNVKKQAFRFRKGAHKEERRIGDTVYTIDGWLDAPRYMNYGARKPVKGTSSSVLSNIAKDCDLKFYGAGTNDAQTWYPLGKPLSAFAAEVAKHGWATDTSCLCMSVTLDRSLVYRDVTSMDAPVATLGVLDVNTDGVLPVTAVEPDAASSSSNWQSGYGNVHVEQQVDSKQNHYTQHVGVGMRVNEPGSLQVNSSVKPAQPRVTVGPISMGNGHPSYARAAYQNRRVAQLFSVSVQTVVPVLTTVRSLDTVLLRTDALSSLEANALKMYAGTYRVARRVIWITPGYLVEKLQLVRRTLNVESSNAVAPESPVQQQVTQASPGAPSIPSQVPSPQKFSIPIGAAAVTGLVSAFAPVLAKQAIAAAKDLAKSAIQSVTSLANGASDTLKAKMESTDFNTRYTALIAEIASIRDAGVADILAYKATLPTDPFGQIPIKVANYKAQIATAINNQRPALEREEAAARLTVEAASDVISSNPWGASSKVSTAASKTLAAQVAGARGQADDDAATANTELTDTATASAASATAKQTEATTVAQDLQATLDNWEANLTTEQTNANNALDTAGIL